MADVFVSYSRKDLDRAKVVAMALEQRGWSVWWDADVPIGGTWDGVLEEELANARSVVVLWSPASVASNWVKNEARDAKNRGILIPALIKPTKLPTEFSHLQTADLTGWKPGQRWSVEFEKLLASLRRVLGQSDEAHTADNFKPPETPTTPPPQVGKQPRAMFGWIFAALCVLAGIWWGATAYKSGPASHISTGQGAGLESLVTPKPPGKSLDAAADYYTRHPLGQGRK